MPRWTVNLLYEEKFMIVTNTRLADDKVSFGIPKGSLPTCAYTSRGNSCGQKLSWGNQEGGLLQVSGVQEIDEDCQDP